MNQVIETNGRIYEVIRTIPVWQVGDKIDALKAWVECLHCDRSFKHGDKYYIVRDIDDISYEQIT